MPAELSTSPLRPGYLPYFSFQVVMEQKEEGSLENPDPRFHKISTFHGRSYEMTDRILWGDEYGNIFLSFSTKGNNHTNPSVMRSATAPSGFIPMGVMEGDALLRIMRASNAMRKAGIATEAVVKVMKPETLFFKGDHLSQEEFKRRLVLDAWENAESASARISRKDIPDVSMAFSGMEFYTVVRSLQVSERIEDLASASGEAEFTSILGRIFDSINRIEHARKNPDWQDLEVNNESYIRYFKQILPQKIARNYAKLHDIGLIHVFPHAGNITAFGEICDLDSVKGIPTDCGDKKVGVRDVRADVRYLLNSTTEAVSIIQERFPVMDSFVGTFRDTLILEYLKRRQTGHFVQNLALFEADQVELLAQLACGEELVAIATEKLGIEFTYENGQADIDEYTKDHPEIVSIPGNDEDFLVIDLGGLVQFTYERVEKDFLSKNKEKLAYFEKRFGKKPVRNLILAYANYWNERVFNLVDSESIDLGCITLNL